MNSDLLDQLYREAESSIASGSLAHASECIAALEEQADDSIDLWRHWLPRINELRRQMLDKTGGATP